MKEADVIFKSYLRTLLRRLEMIKEAADTENYEELRSLLEGLIEDTQAGIEDEISNEDEEE